MDQLLRLLYLNFSEQLNLLEEHGMSCGESVGNSTFLIVAYSILIAVGLTGNLCLVCVIVQQKEMRNVTNIFIANLSFSDILVSLVCMPVTVIYTLMDHWILGEVVCKVSPFVQCVSVTVSILSLVWIALERHQLIINPTGWKPAANHAYMAVGLTWVVACGISLPFLSFTVLTNEPFQNLSLPFDSLANHLVCVERWPSDQHRLTYTTFLLLFQYCLPLLLILACYFRIFLRLQHRKDMVERAKDGSRATSHRKVNIMLACIVVAFAACWFPLMFFNALYDWDHQKISVCYYNLIFSLCHLTAMASTCINPVIYGFLNSNFQKEVKALLYRCSCSREKEKYETFPLSTVSTEVSKASLHSEGGTSLPA
ncbi:PREDICTED: neuropeptide Y receptor type 4-like [Thamnophis sirtalis]|uniref:Neuropeptide Y receptor type 4-like n=1 Tax=Thamnophis sirtalis TaxID=35019 RepID=A0A6I9YFW0_9SAUR|nr:PREDICTED: neuropeptide Y receptor type 4-like [Thamnophis sirtalis]